MATTKQMKVWGLDWTKNASSDGGAQKLVIDAMDFHDIPVCSITKKTGRMWTSVNKETYLKLITKNHGIYEIIRPDCKRKVYFDVDWTGDSRDAPTLDTIKEKILAKFPDGLMAVSGSITDSKTSYHIVLLNYHFNNQNDQSKMLRWIHELALLGVDHLVYTKNRLMKCVNQSKPDGRVQADMSGHTSEEHSLLLVDLVMSKDAAEHVEWKTEFVLDIEKKQRVDVLSLPQMDWVAPTDFDWFSADPIEILNVIPCAPLDHNTIWKIMLWCQSTGLNFEQFWEWNKQKTADVERLERYHTDWHRSFGLSSPGLRFIKTILERFYPLITRDQSTERLLSSFHIPEERLSIEPFYLQKADLSELTQKFVLLTGSMGSNKTGSVIENLALESSILWLTPRVTLTNNTAKRLEERFGPGNFKDYKDYKASPNEICSFDRLLCCLPSLWQTNEKTYDTLVIDEIETLIMLLQGGQGKPGWSKIGLNFRRLVTIVQSAKKVYAMDAFMSKRTIDLFKQICPNSTLVALKNSALPEQRIFIECPEKLGWINQIAEKIKAGENVFVFYPYKNENKKNISMLQLCAVVAEKAGISLDDIIYYNSGQSDQVKNTTSEVTKVWKTKRCVITNSCITVGVNFEGSHFHSVCAYYAKWLSQRDFFQSLYRCRKIKTNNIYLFQEGKRGKSSSPNNTPWIHSDYQNPIYLKLLASIKNEVNSAGCSFVFDYYATAANIIYGGTLEATTKQVKADINELILRSECHFKWSKIRDINVFEYENGLQTVRNCLTRTIDTALEVHKYTFRQKFSHMVPDDVVQNIWDSHLFNGVAGIQMMLAEPWKKMDSPETTIIRSIFESNDAGLSLELPIHPKWKYDSASVRSCFDTRIVDEHIQNNAKLVSVLLKAYFNMNVYEPSKTYTHEPGKNNNKLPDYKMNDHFINLKNEIIKWRVGGTAESQDQFEFSTDY